MEQASTRYCLPEPTRKRLRKRLTRGQAAQGAQHGPAGVDQLQLAVALEGLGVSRQTGGVPAVVAGELARQVGGGGILGVGACAEADSTERR
jgi:hypothetical protein